MFEDTVKWLEALIIHALREVLPEISGSRAGNFQKTIIIRKCLDRVLKEDNDRANASHIMPAVIQIQSLARRDQTHSLLT
jgi:hypothetical protein